MRLAQAMLYRVSPGYFRTASTTLLSGRTFTWRDDQNAPSVAVVNREFARKVFGSVKNAMYSYYKLPAGTKVQVVGIVENGKYASLTEESQAAAFSSILQSPASATTLVAHSKSRSQASSGGDESQAAGPGCGASLLHPKLV